MLSLQVSNRTENLLNCLADLLREGPGENPLAAELFLIQSQGMERMVAQSLASAFGSFCNFKFFLPLDFLAFIASRLGQGSPDGFARQILAWRLDELLRDMQDEVYRPLRLYLQGENAEVKRFQLARRLANIFDQYQLMRSGMLMKWEKGERATAHPAESWQMDLWRRLSGQAGAPAGMHRGELFRQVANQLIIRDDLAPLLPRRISVIGLHTMPPIYLDYLNRLARHMDVHLLLLSPCRHYWGDAENVRTRLRRQLGDPNADENFEYDHHPLLTTLGRQGRDFQNMLLEGVEGFLESDSYDDPLEDGEYDRTSLLKRIQADLLDDVVPRPTTRPALVPDDSIRVVSCHSKLRELAVLKDHLLQLLHTDQTLKLRDIVVMAPDIQEYAALIPAVFAGIQHSIADRSARRRNPFIAAYLAFLDLLTGRFGWSEMLDLLRQEAIFPQFELTGADLDILERWVTESGIRWGLSGAARSDAGLPNFAEGTWQAGLERLLMGYAIDASEFVDGVLPYPDIEGRGAQPLGGLCRFVALIDEARRAFAHRRLLAEWSETLLSYARQLFGEVDAQPLTELQTILAQLAESAVFHRSSVGFPVIREWLTQSARESRSSSGFLRGQLTFCSMLPMRSIPFRVVCLLGLNDGVFPKNDRHETFDLMAGDFRPGDRSPRADDRYQFLEALLAARSHLYLSYVGQSIRTGDSIPPSVVVTEFLELLEFSYGVMNVVVNHPLHPFSSRYFSGEEARLFSYDEYACRTASVLQQGSQETDRWWNGRTEDEVKAVELNDLLRFFANPPKFFVTYCLGIRLAQRPEVPEEREMFAPSRLDLYGVDQELVGSGFSGDGGAVLESFQCQGRWPLGTPGRVLLTERRAEADRFLQKVAAEALGRELPAVPVDITVGPYRLTGSLKGFHERGLLLARFGLLRGRDLVSCWLHHLVANQLQASTETRLVAMDISVRLAGDMQGPSLERLLELFAEGCRRPLPLLVEPAFACARQEQSSRARTSPAETAAKVYRTSLERGYEPEWQLLYGQAEAEEVLDEEFHRLCREVFVPLWVMAYGS